MENRCFNVGYARYDQAKSEDVFLSVTPGFEHGPGIQRDGISQPHMTNPHRVAYVCNALGLEPQIDEKQTTIPHLQRAGTWTLYNHLKRFHDTLGKQGWRIIGAQGHGDLTMNYWHVAYCNQEEFGRSPIFCALRTEEDSSAREPYQERSYRCLIKWKETSGRHPRLSFHNVHFRAAGNIAGVSVHLADENNADVTGKVSFAMAAKTIIENRQELTLEAVIDKFDDVRHIFALREVAARGHHKGHDINKAVFGEYNLFTNLNERRAALHSSVVIPLSPINNLSYDQSDVMRALQSAHFKHTQTPSDIPTLRGQFREFPLQIHDKGCIDIFFTKNVYPFGVIGIPEPKNSIKSPGAEVICLSSGGLSGRIGNTLEGITRIMYDFLACGEAMILDEGLDVFQLINSETPNSNLRDHATGNPRFTNEQILNGVAHFCHQLIESERAECKTKFTQDPADFPLNKQVFEELNRANASTDALDPNELFAVAPQRSQIRAVMIFAKKMEDPNKA
jgi:hypothetical protein